MFPAFSEGSILIYHTENILPVDVLEAVNKWLGTFAELLRNQDHRAVSHVKDNTRFWHDLPELMHIITTQT